MSSKETVIPIATNANGRFAMRDTLSYTQRLNLLKKAAERYADEKQRNRSFEPTKDLADRARLALDALDLVHDDLGRRKFEQDWGEETLVFDRYLHQVNERTREATSSLPSPEKPTRKDAVAAAYKVGRVLVSRDTSKQQKARLLLLSGYSKDEVSKKIKNIAVSTTLTAVNVGLFSTTLAASTGFGLFHPFLDDISQPSTQLAAFLSYTTHYLFLTLNSYQNVRLLKSDVNNSTNAFATGTYYLLEKFLPRQKKIRDAICTAIPMIPFVIEEIGFVSGLYLDPSVTVARNLGLGILNAVESGANEIWLRRGRKGFTGS